MRYPPMGLVACLVCVFVVLVGCGGGGDDSAVSVPSEFDFEGPECPFETTEDEFASYECVEGVYRVAVANNSVFQFKTVDLVEPVSALSVEADLVVPRDPEQPSAVGLSCLESGNSGYLFMLSTDGVYWIWKQWGLGPEERERLAPLDASEQLLADPSEVLRIDPFRNRIRAICSTDEQTASARSEINGEVALSVDDPDGFEQFSRLALVVFAAAPGDEFDFDNITIRRPEPADLAREPESEPPEAATPSEAESLPLVEEEFAPPLGEPDPALMALRPTDMPSEFVVVAEGYVDPEGSVATFEREFEVAGDDAVAVGGSRLYWVSSDPDVFASENEATVFSLGLRGVCESPEVFEELLESGAAAEGEPIQCSNVETIEVDDLGDRAIGARADFQGTPVRGITEEGTFLLLTFQVGRTVHSLWVVGEDINTDDIVDLARIQVERAEAELAAAGSG